MRRRGLGIVAILAIALAGTLAACGGSSTSQHHGPTVVATATATPFPKGWSEVSTPGVGQEGNLVAVTALSSTGAWAVGQYEGVDSLQHTLIEHWDGGHWSVQQSPSPGQEYNLLRGVSASSATDAWVVGDDISTDGVEQPLIEHWDGTSWTVSGGPAVGKAGGEFDGVAAISPTNAWAVGFVNLPSSANAAPGYQPLLEHWDGHTWSIVQSAALPAQQNQYNSVPNNELHAITALSANDIWAAGGDNAGSSAPGIEALLEHWDGHVWSILPSANPNQGDDTLTGLAGVSTNDVWAVGSGSFSGPFGCGIGVGALTEHWDGSQWSSVQVAQPAGNAEFSLASIAAVSSNDVWAVGGVLSYASAESTVVEPVIEHWDGSHWALASGPADATVQGLAGIAAASGGTTWAVGQVATPNGPAETLVEQENAGQWSVAASPSPGTLRNALNGVAALSTSDVWAVGDSAGGTLAEHWNGNSWSVFTTPNVASHENVLNGVSGVASNDVWAVGSSDERSVNAQALIEHWNGSDWSAVSGASMRYATLYGVAALSATNAWAVGNAGSGPLIEHWDGTRWTVVPNPASTPSVYMNDYTLYSVAAVAADDVWAAGGLPAANCSSPAPALIEHWDGKQWSVETGLPQGVLHGVAAASANDAWAVGQLGNSAVMLHWDGKQWATVQGAALPIHAYPTLQAVAVHTNSDVWAVGYGYDSGGATVLEVQHWDGHAWTATQLNAPGVVDNRLNGIAAVATGEFWAVGSYDDWSERDAHQSLIEHYQP